MGHAVDKLKVLLTRRQIADKVAELGARITADFRGEPVLLIGVLKGAAIFLSDLAREIELDVSFDFVAASSYGTGTHSSGSIRLMKDVDHPLEGKNVIVVEDILDTGLTLAYLKEQFAGRGPKTLRVAALLDKTSRRVQPVRADYVGFEIPDEFVVGYGLDYAQRYRNLPDICVLEQ
jgi:hypoxanthine phosphoribosyltransferase